MGNTSQKQNPNPQIQSFLESLRQRSAGLPLQREGQLSLEKFQEKKRLEEQRKAEFFRERTREFNQIYSHQKQEEAAKIDQIREKLKSLATSVKKLNQEIHNAAIENTPAQNTGIYQETFLEHLSSMIDLLKRQVESSSSWLHVFNTRSQKKNYYWGMVGKKGTSFMLSNERQVATSIG